MADELSRIAIPKGNDENKESKRVINMLGKYVRVIEGEEFWIFDSGEIRKYIGNKEKQKELIIKVHRELIHRSHEYVYYDLRKEYYWPRMREIIIEHVSECEVCLQMDRKKKNKTDFVITYSLFEIVAVYMMDCRSEGKYVLWQ